MVSYLCIEGTLGIPKTDLINLTDTEKEILFTNLPKQKKGDHIIFDCMSEIAEIGGYVGLFLGVPINQQSESHRIDLDFWENLPDPNIDLIFWGEQYKPSSIISGTQVMCPTNPHRKVIVYQEPTMIIEIFKQNGYKVMKTVIRDDPNADRSVYTQLTVWVLSKPGESTSGSLKLEPLEPTA